jgi:hypothetical protein
MKLNNTNIDITVYMNYPVDVWYSVPNNWIGASIIEEVGSYT